MRKPEFYAAVYGIIKNDEGKILMIKRKNTGYLDGWFGLPAGHLEGTESLVFAMKRELEEEVGIQTLEKDIRLIHTNHRIDTDRIYFDFYFEISHYIGIPRNAEPEKSEGIYWIDISIEEKIQNKIIFKRIENDETFSETNNRL